MGWSYTSPQPHLKIEYKDLMPLKIFKEKRKRRAGKKKGKEKEMEGGKEQEKNTGIETRRKKDTSKRNKRKS